MFYLTVTFWLWTQSPPQFEAVIMPAPYETLEACVAAGKSSAENYIGGAKIEYMCTPVM